MNDKQKEAVLKIDGPLLILAGAGSGKTSTMTHRIAHMIEEGIDPYSILAVTFTNKAAGEMRSRVEELIGDALDMWIMTFHAMCLRILHMNAEAAGYKDNFVIYDTQDQKTLVKNIVKDKGYNEKEFAPQYVLAVISDCKEKEIGPSEFLDETGNSEKNRSMHAIYEEYEHRLKANNAMDFDDLLLNTVKLFKNNKDVLARYQRRFRYVMVDEYQDTNHIQYELVSMLAAEHHNICVVGDDDQCIYEWRGADIRNILDFEKDFPEAKVVKLEQNYRSCGNILDAAHSVIKNNKGRKDKKLWTSKDKGDKLIYHRLSNDKEEAGHVAREISYLHMNKGMSYNDIAILYRTNAQSRLFEEALTREGIPYRVLSGTRYYDRKEIKDIMAYMRLIVNPSDDLSLFRVINEPKRGIGAKTIEKLQAFAAVRGQSVLEALTDGDEDMLSSIPGKAYDKVRDMVSCINHLRAEKETLKVSDIFDALLVRTGYMKALEEQNTVEADGRIENLMEFKSVIYDYENEEEQPTIEGFMAQLTLAADVDDYDENDETVTLMTMHSAKGLEFNAVFMPGMEDGLFPGNKSFDSIDGMEEERRLCYVGITRAKKLLYLSSAEVRNRYGRTEFTRESQFLREIDKTLMTGDAVYEKNSRMGGIGVPTGSYDGASGEPYYPFGGNSGGGGSYGGSSAAMLFDDGDKPFDSLKYAKKETKIRAGASKPSSGDFDSEFNVGDHVQHPKFGRGLVTEVSARAVRVDFGEEGSKKLAVGVAPIKKCD